MSAYLNTRVSLFADHLWRAEQFRTLMRASEAEIPNALSEGGLERLAGVVAGKDIHSLEQSIIAQLLDETLILLRPLTGPERAFLLYWTERFEVTNLKTLLRGKMTGERPAALLTRLTPMGTFGKLDAQDLAHAEDVTELLRRLETGHYAGIVRQARQAFEDSRDPFLLDAALDRGYYEGLARRAQELEKQHGPALRQLMGPLIDRINLVWLLRYRFNYKLPPAQVYYLLVSAHYGLSGSRLKELAALGSLEAVLAALPDGLKQSLEGAATIPEVFARMERAASGQAEKVLASSAPAIARAFAYLILRERDLRAVRAVLRGRYLHLPVDMISETLGQLSEEAY
ncbi:MAG: V-type ATPase subunit [Hydrogenophilales bacterium]|nr:V-type ATPase subunit [Hydrogenophilales bacterium]